MSLTTFDLKDMEKRMRASLDGLKRELSGLRTGRANAALLEPVQVTVYGTKMPINQVATITVPEARLITVQVWDKSNAQAVDKALREANLGVNPILDGAIIRLPIPAPTAERRQELAKQAHKYAENHRVAVRNVRRDVHNDLRDFEKEKLISEDELKHGEADLQKLTDKYIEQIEAMGKKKEEEIKRI